MNPINELATFQEIRVFGPNGSRVIAISVCRKVFEVAENKNIVKSGKDRPVFFKQPTIAELQKLEGKINGGEGAPKVLDSKSFEGPFANIFILPRESEIDQRVYRARRNTGRYGNNSHLLPGFR